MYVFSDDPADLANNDYKGFFEQYAFLIKEEMRLLLPGRIVAVHAMDMPTYKRSGEEIGLRDFCGDIIRAHEKEGFIYHSRHVIWKDPLIAATRTKAIGLAHKQICKDSAMCRTGIPDYILAFRKPGENPKPIKNENGLTSYHGARPVPSQLDKFMGYEGDQGKNKRSQYIWQKYASPIWDDIRQTRVLAYRGGKEEDDQKHIAPLQLDVVERCIALWSAPDDIVCSPFMGIGTEVYVACMRGRKGLGVEIKPSYYKTALKNLRTVEQREDRTLFEE